VSVSFVDVAQRPPAPAELRRFSQRFGAAVLLDTAGRAYTDAGLAHMHLDEDEIMERLLAQPALLRLPLVRWGSNVSVGPAETAWRSWLSQAE
jgi:arsenate reductase